jgi:hypothetical protein
MARHAPELVAGMDRNTHTRWAMRTKISMMSANMTRYPSVCKTAHYAPAPAELEFARTGSGREQESVFPLDQRPVKAQQRRRPDSNCNLREAIGGDPEGTNAEQEPIPGSQSRSSIARSVEDDQLMLQKE